MIKITSKSLPTDENKCMTLLKHTFKLIQLIKTSHESYRSTFVLTEPPKSSHVLGMIRLRSLCKYHELLDTFYKTSIKGKSTVMSADKLKYAVFIAGDKSVRNDNYYALEKYAQLLSDFKILKKTIYIILTGKKNNSSTFNSEDSKFIIVGQYLKFLVIFKIVTII
ncbi:Uncharacterized protein FWK35_00018516 [Aphis craccivora]|uniref:Uncharacterized protein n=1 Tax=Aphis craccivora TaxID=307492 RepID=A0A6G0YF29_APHCR|nr:Uncharacterized protein FWK35_00018516 [Aphis craccivora]